MMTFLLLALSSQAQAGKLAEGFRGVTFGFREAFLAPEETGCTANPELAVAWSCEHTIGDVSVSSAYLYQLSYITSVMVTAKGFSDCSKLIDTLEGAYGKSKPLKSYATGRMDARYWADGEMWATYEWNKYSSTCTLGILHNPSVKKVAELKKAEAGKAASDL